MAEAEVSGSRFISSKVSVVGESAAVFERFVAPVAMSDSRPCLVSETGKCTVRRCESEWWALVAEAQSACHGRFQGYHCLHTTVAV